MIESVPGEVAATALVGPRVYIPAKYLGRTGLLVFGSRADYRAVVKLPATITAEQFEARFRGFLTKQRVRIRTVEDNEANLTEAIDHLRNFLSMVGLIAMLLGGLGVASGVNAFVLRKIDTVAVLRCLGATSGQVVVIYVLQAAAMGLVGAIMGTVLGVAAQFALPQLLADYLPKGIVVAFVPRAVVLGLGIGVWVALVFSLRPLLALKRVSPLQALRREADAVVMRRIRRDSSAAVVSFATVASIFALTISRADDWQEGLGYAFAILAAVGALYLVATVLTGAARRLVRPEWPFVLRHAIASLHRPGNQTRAVVLSLGFGVFLMSTLYQAQTNLRRQIDRRMLQFRANVVFFDVQGPQAPGSRFHDPGRAGPCPADHPDHHGADGVDQRPSDRLDAGPSGKGQHRWPRDRAGTAARPVAIHAPRMARTGATRSIPANRPPAGGSVRRRTAWRRCRSTVSVWTCSGCRSAM